jgi:hypothetical protein
LKVECNGSVSARFIVHTIEAQQGVIPPPEAVF